MGDTNSSLLKSCENAQCGWGCCKFGQSQYIIALPNELDQAELSTDHLEVIQDDYFGGKKVRCKARDTSNCDGGYKPIQCRIYPLWIKGDGSTFRSMKCPLSNEEVTDHVDEAKTVIDEYREKNPDVNVKSFLDGVSINRYKQL